VVKNVLGVDPYAADEGLIAWARPAPVHVEEKATPVRAERHEPRSTRKRGATRYYYYGPRYERPRGFGELFFGR
jgi:hypothetical protein